MVGLALFWLESVTDSKSMGILVAPTGYFFPQLSSTIRPSATLARSGPRPQMQPGQCEQVHSAPYLTLV